MQPRLRAAPRPLVFSNAGQFELSLYGVPLAVIAEVAGVSKMAASLWTRGVNIPDEDHAELLKQHFDTVFRHLWAQDAPKSEGERLCLLFGVRPPAAPDGFERLMLWSFFFVPLESWDQKPGRLRNWASFRAAIASELDLHSLPKGEPPAWGLPSGGWTSIMKVLKEEDRRHGWDTATRYAEQYRRH